MSFDHNKLRGRIVEKYGTQAAFAESIGMSAQSLGLKMNNKVDWSREDIVKACELLKISLDEMPLYFFYQES